MDDIPSITAWMEDIEDLSMFDRRLAVPLDPASMELEWRDCIVAREPRDSYWFMIQDDDMLAVGLVGITEINFVHGAALMPMFVAQTARNQGIAVRTRAVLLDFAFEQLRLVRITSLHRADNEASKRLSEACGFQEEGRIRNAWYAGGRYVDQMICGILADEWRAHRRQLSGRLGRDAVVSLGSRKMGQWSWPPAVKDAVAAD
jgi:RimJ/RimL family protein N-acetyltransferase